MRDLGERITPSETLVAAWYDERTGEVGVQYGYVVISLPREDLADLVGCLAEAQRKLEEGKSSSGAGG